MLDRVLAAASFGMFFGFLGILLNSVHPLDLNFFICAVLAMTGYDFFRSVFLAILIGFLGIVFFGVFLPILPGTYLIIAIGVVIAIVLAFDLYRPTFGRDRQL